MIHLCYISRGFCMSDEQERRRETRYKLRNTITAQIKPAGLGGMFAKPVNIMVINVSPKGVGIHSKEAPPGGSDAKVKVTVLGLGNNRTFSGKIKHLNIIQSGYMFGIELDLPKHESLISYFKSCEAEFDIR
ncbi:PilZ domain-containing protein [Corallincola holothuriorum]|uniref:PilZ domain-containing protein n=4 Tax=Psychromonadaceae TaxID=267894 RepID=A0A368N681_9GAMM|nr:PilZ domain-containing protein [Corallincola holothuriorum]TAA46890.1 PilZ domain-containing protein [Corallincola spongiicola]